MYKNKYLNLRGGVLTKSQKEIVEELNLRSYVLDTDTYTDDEFEHIVSQLLANPSSIETPPIVRPPNPLSAEDHSFTYPPIVRPYVEDQCSTFYIYTTGLNDDDIIIDIWFDILYKNILSCIPLNFKNIIVIHYDPIILGASKSKNHHLIFRLSDSKYKNQQIIYTELPIKDLNRPHIVIDMAHIFGYYPNEINKYDAYWSGYYDSDLYRKYNSSSRDNSTPLNIKSIYIGFNRSDIAQCSSLISVQPNGNVRTFIDCLIDLKILSVGEIMINDVIDGIVTKIRNILISKWKETDKTYLEFETFEKTFEETFENNYFVCLVIEKLFKCETLDELYNIEDSSFYKKLFST
jgi:hypothetical protein